MTAASATPESTGRAAARAGELLLPYLALVALHLLGSLAMRQPLVLADELGYLGNARYLAGTAHLPDMQGSQFYHFGYSLFLLPAFWLLRDPLATYKAVMVINALLASALFFPLRLALLTFLGAPARAAGWIAFACCLYPSLLFHSSLAWSENAIVPFYVLAMALFARFLARRGTGDALLFGLVAGFLYTIHPRALPVLAAILVYLLALALLREISPRRLLAAVSPMALVFLATRAVNSHLKAAAWGGGGEVSVAKLAGRLVPGSDFVALVERALGQLLYVSLATHGLFLLGLMGMLWAVWRGLASGTPRRVLGEPATGAPLLILGSAGGVFAAACTLKLYSLHGERAVRGADFIHGRYNEALAILALAFALAELCRGDPGRRRLAWRVAVAIGLLVVLGLVVMAEVDDALGRQVGGRSGGEARDVVLPGDVDAVAVPGVYPLVGLLGEMDLRWMAVIAAGALLSITLALRLSWRAGVALLVLLFGTFAYYNHRSYLLPRMAGVEPRLALAAELRRLGPPAALSVDVAYREPGLAAGLQYLLPQTVFGRFDSRDGVAPPSEAVIAAANWSQAPRLGARFVLASGRGGALWLLPGEMQARLPAPRREGENLAVRQALDLQQTGFYRLETFDGVPGRWTNGAAAVTVPLDPADPPRRLRFGARAPGRQQVRLRLLANGVELSRQPLPRAGWSRELSLDGVPLGDELRLEILSDTFSPAARRPGSRDRRRLGIVVTEIRLD